jgi:hypothetical protein
VREPDPKKRMIIRSITRKIIKRDDNDKWNAIFADINGKPAMRCNLAGKSSKFTGLSLDSAAAKD